MARRVAPERIFLSHFPDAAVEYHRNQFSGGYFLVRRRGAQMWSGEGATRAKAWADACSRCKLTGLKEAP